MHTENVSYVDGEQELEGYLAYDPVLEGPRPAVLVAHAWAGQSDFERKTAERLAELGYAGFALDMYGKGILGSGPEENQKLMTPFVEDRALLRARIQAGLHTLANLDVVDRTKIAAVGFCFGGLCALDLARSGAAVTGVATLHGLLIPPGLDDNPDQIATKILVLHGQDDPFVPPEQVQAFAQEMTGAGADWQLHVFGGARHAFAHREAHAPEIGNVYDERAERRSWQQVSAFLAEVFA